MCYLKFLLYRKRIEELLTGYTSTRDSLIGYKFIGSLLAAQPKKKMNLFGERLFGKNNFDDGRANWMTINGS